MLRVLRKFERQREATARRIPVKKVAFMFLTKGPLPFAPLWERFFKVRWQQGAILEGKGGRLRRSFLGKSTPPSSSPVPTFLFLWALFGCKLAGPS